MIVVSSAAVDAALPKRCAVLLRRPAAIDRQRAAGDRPRRVACEKDRERAELPHAGEALLRLLRKQLIAEISGTDRVTGDVVLSGLEGGHLGETDDAVPGGHVGGLEP